MTAAVCMCCRAAPATSQRKWCEGCEELFKEVMPRARAHMLELRMGEAGRRAADVRDHGATGESNVRRV